jgi:hypothetical protein
MEQEWRMDKYNSCCNLNKRNGIAWFLVGIQKLARMSNRKEMGRCLPCREEENVLSILLKYMEKQRCR